MVTSKTKLQKAFSTSRIARRMSLELLQLHGIEPAGYKRMMNGVISVVVRDLPEATIKQFLYSCLQCTDLTLPERETAIKLLRMAETALTREQLAVINHSLQEG